MLIRASPVVELVRLNEDAASARMSAFPPGSTMLTDPQGDVKYLSATVPCTGALAHPQHLQCTGSCLIRLEVVSHVVGSTFVWQIDAANAGMLLNAAKHLHAGCSMHAAFGGMC
jgi:hypothetical protein